MQCPDYKKDPDVEYNPINMCFDCIHRIDGRCGLNGEPSTFWFGGIVKSDRWGMFKEGDVIKPRWITKEQSEQIKKIMEGE